MKGSNLVTLFTHLSNRWVSNASAHRTISTQRTNVASACILLVCLKLGHKTIVKIDLIIYHASIINKVFFYFIF
jgi:hypothetical protein